MWLKHEHDSRIKAKTWDAEVLLTRELVQIADKIPLGSIRLSGFIILNRFHMNLVKSFNEMADGEV